ncbi:TonB-dependent receptor [Gracilimonas tropica]|uniref:TonB-dependent receptor n=1 Tax=Gracilimonas tropica TaxID=454600 RepID=UPI00036C26C7|nr:carboxypeptidase-like regulatory domain-containing protein [Gracilimonas tropica]
MNSKKGISRVVKFFLIFACGLISHHALAQYTIEGLVSDSQTSQPLELANMVLLTMDEQIYKGTTTDINGLYQISGIESGRYILKASYVGYQLYTDTLTFEGTNFNRRKSIRMTASDEAQGEVTVTHSGRTADLDAGQRKISRIELERVPTPGASGDIASYLQTLPGVVSTGDRGGQLFVRGGTPSENMVLVDGQLIYQPFHIIGFFSAFPQELVANADFYAGGYSSRYIGRTSSVLDVKLRHGNKYEYAGSASISPFVSELYMEGPIIEGKTSAVVSARQSLIEGASALYPMEDQPLKFDSQFLKVSYNNNQGGTCSMLFMRTYDRGKMDFEQGDSFSWNNFVTGARCSGLSDGEISLFDVNVGFSHVSNLAGQNLNSDQDGFLPGPDTESDNKRTSKSSLFNLDINLTQFLKDVRFDYGFFLKVNAMSYDIRELFVSNNEDSQTQYSLGSYLEANIPIGNTINFYPGTAFSVSKSYKPSIEPRARFSWQPRGKDNEELNAAFGVYRQPLTGITDNRDAGSAFTAWVPVPRDAKQMESIHALLGWRQPLGEHFNVSVEGYHKWISNKPVAVWGTVAQFTTEIANADGISYGGDINIDYYGRYLFLSIGYGYALTEYETQQELFEAWYGTSSQKYNPAHDRRHKINAQASLDIQKYRFNISWQLGSGLPYTRPLGFDDLIRFEDHLPNIKNVPGVPRIILDKPYDGRLPIYHRLDFSLERSFNVQSSEVEMKVGAINTYNQENIFYYDVYTQRQINQLPFYPYASLKLSID